MGFDDRDGFREIMRNNGKEITPEILEVFIHQKTQLVLQRLRESVTPIPGAREIILEASSEGMALAVCSGSLRDEIIAALEGANVADCFSVIVSANDVTRGKPDPEGYYKARRLLAEYSKRPVEPQRCVVCEDTPAGIAAAKEAGMQVCALKTTHKAEDLAGADMVADDFQELTLARLRERVLPANTPDTMASISTSAAS